MIDSIGPYLLGPNDTEENGIYTGDARELAKEIPPESIDLIFTDPPYPDWLAIQFKFAEEGINFLGRFTCRQFVFWSKRADFPLSFTAIHIWDKLTGAGSFYERIFERYGGNAYKVFRHYLINSTVAASYTRDIFTGYPTQKPANLIREILEWSTTEMQTVLDPFTGSGTIPAVCKMFNRRYLAFEIDPDVAQMARDRVRTTQPPLPISIPEQGELL